MKTGWLWLCLLLCSPILAQTVPADRIGRDSSNQISPAGVGLTLSGYVKYLNTVSIPSVGGDWVFDNQVHNRLKLRYQPLTGLTVAVDARNRLYFGESIRTNPLFVLQITRTLDYVRLGGIIFQQRSFLLHSVVDRAYLDYHRGGWQLTVGKQRVNWGKSYVWNPNDIFNAYSFFDFDYEERPGTDALLVRRYVGTQASIEVVANWVGGWRQNTVTALYRFNRQSTDYQLLAGRRDSSWVVGAGWAGQLRDAGVKGELTWFSSSAGRVSTFVGDVSVEYTFPHALTLRAEAIVNSNPLRSRAFTYLSEPVTARTLINNYVSVFGTVSYELTPLIVTSVSSIWHIDDGSYFINPSVNINLHDNTELLVTAQLLAGRPGSLFADAGSYVFTRLKWSF